MTVASTVVFSLGFLCACLLGLIACRLVWVRAVRLTRVRLERDRPETLRAFEARIAGAQARAAISIRELERALERERQISAQARLMADQMTSSSALALAERDDTQSSLVGLSDSLNTTRERLREQEELLVQRNTDLADIQRDLADARHEVAMRDEDIKRLTGEADALRAELAAHMAGDSDPSAVQKLAQSGDAASMARAQIESMRETVRDLRAEKNAAEASAARARLLLDARDDNEAVAAAKADFDAERAQMMARIQVLESELASAGGPKGPQLVSDNTAKTKAASADVSQGTQPDMLRASIDAMTATLAATAAMNKEGLDKQGSERINALLDEADESGADSSLVTSLVEARDRLRNKKGATPGKAKTPAKRSASTGAKGNTKLAAATASGSGSSGAAEKPSGMPKASESDLKVI